MNMQLISIIISGFVLLVTIISSWISINVKVGKLEQKLTDTCDELKEVKNDYRHELKEIRLLINNLKSQQNEKHNL